MARQAYPDLPLYRYDWTPLREGAMRDALSAVALRGPEAAAGAEMGLAGKTLTIVADEGPVLSYRFTGPSELTLMEAGGQPIKTGYGAFTFEKVTLFAHLIPGTLRGYAVVADHETGLATIVELWFGGEPRPREVSREIYHGYVRTGDGPPPAARHEATSRIEGKGLFWTDSRGHETIEFYVSTIYTHVVDRTRLDGRTGYSFPADYIRITEGIYLFTRIEAEFSGIMTLQIVDLNGLRQAGLRLGFDGLDQLEYHMFTGKAEWIGQISRFTAFGDVSGNPLKAPGDEKGARAVYRPLATMDKLTPAEVDAVAARTSHAFTEPSAMAGHGLPPSGKLAGRAFTLRYDDGLRMDYRFESADSLRWRMNDGPWTTTRYNAWEGPPGVFIFGHFLTGTPGHDGHMVTVDLEAGLATLFRGYLNTPYIANEAWAETSFGVAVGEGIPDPGARRHGFTDELLGRCMTWSYSPGLTSMHLYSSPNTISWIIFTPSGHGGMQWSGPGDYVKIRDGLYFVYWREDACNGALGTILINMNTMHDSGIDYHCDKKELKLGPVGAYARHAGRFDIARFYNGKDKA